MLAKLKDKKAYLKEARFNWELKVIKKSRDKQSIKLENWLWYCSIHLELKKESWWARNKKPKQELVLEKDNNDIQINVWNVNTLLKEWEYQTKIEMLQKECESWMEDYNNAKQEKMRLEWELQYKLYEMREKRNFWRTWLIAYAILDIWYIIIKSLWM